MAYLLARNIVLGMSGRWLRGIDDRAVLGEEAEDIDGKGVDADALSPAIASEVLDCLAVAGAGIERGWSAESEGGKGHECEEWGWETHCGGWCFEV